MPRHQDARMPSQALNVNTSKTYWIHAYSMSSSPLHRQDLRPLEHSKTGEDPADEKCISLRTHFECKRRSFGPFQETPGQK